MREKRIVRVQCRDDGHTDEWIDFDVSGWTVREYRAIPDAHLTATLEEWVEVDSVDWYVVGIDGEPVLHPGRGTSPDDWLKVYAKLSLDRANWLSLTSYLALQEACQPSKKRAKVSEDGGSEAAGK